MTPVQPIVGLGAFRASNYTDSTQTGTGYPLTIDADLAILAKEADLFTPAAMDAPLMKISIGPGWFALGVANTGGGTGVLLMGGSTSGNLIAGSSVITGLLRVDGVFPGMLIQGSGLPLNCTVASVNNSVQGAGQITISGSAVSTLTNVGLRFSQITAAITAPAVNPRNDIVYIDGSSGLIGMSTGAESTTPVDPTIPAGKVAVARVRLSGSGVTAITNSMIDPIPVARWGATNTPWGLVRLDGSGNLPSTLITVPTGAIIDMGGSTAPTGFLECNGSAVSRTTYANLFNYMGTRWGAGDGSTTFNVPNLNGYVTAGRNGSFAFGNTVGAQGGEYQHTLTATESAVLSYSTSGGIHNHSFDVCSYAGGGGGGTVGDGGSATTGQHGTNNSGSLSMSTTSNAGGQPHNIVQMTAVVLKAIKY